MTFEIRTLPEFDQQAKSLAKKYPSLKQDLQHLVESLLQEPHQGIGLGKNCYKVRIRITSKGRGKSAGARVITCIRVVEDVIWLLTIYDKSDRSTITDKELSALVNKIQ